MGSAYFYLEPLLALLTLLKSHYKNPAIFALEYTLVPDSVFPTQLIETAAGYTYALSLVSNDPSRVCVGGDSAGGTLVLSLLLYLAGDEQSRKTKPAYCTLLSPWVTLVSKANRDTTSDYLNAESLHMYGRQYAGRHEELQNPLVSPGSCSDIKWWRNAAPTNGFYIAYGSEEVFGPEIRSFIKLLRRTKISTSVKEEPGAVHAWVIARLFLEETWETRVRGMKELVQAVIENIDPNKTK